jgi:hypothetical protein
VAGEIVRTSRMYAMSVSPLSPAVLERIRPGLFKEMRNDEEGFKKRDKRRIARDFPNNIKIADEVFEIVTIKGKKTVILPWEKLARAAEDAGGAFYKGLKGKIIVNNQYSLLSGEKLELILSLAPTFDIDNVFSRKLPRKENFNSRENPADLIKHLDDLAKPALWKKNSKDLGFIGLFTDGVGNYWLRCSRGFHTSLNQSLFSLETLIDELGEGVDTELKQTVNRCYRRLSDYLE